MKKLVIFCALISANVNAGDLLHLENLEFPSITARRADAENPYYIYRTIIFTAGKVMLDQPTTWAHLDTSSLASDFVEKQNFCELHMAYFSEKGFPKGDIIIEGGKYPVVAQMTPGYSSAGPFTPGVNAPVKYYITRPLRTVSNEHGYASANITVSGVDAEVFFTGIECSLKGMSADLGNVDDAAMIRAGLGETVSVTESK